MLFAEQVGPRRSAGDDGTSGEDRCWRLFFPFRDREADMLGRMPGGCQNLNREFSELDGRAFRQRQVIEGLKFQDRSVKEMAGMMNMSESAVKVTAHRGYRALRRLLGGGRED